MLKNQLLSGTCRFIALSKPNCGLLAPVFFGDDAVGHA
jgi:hypothetical protein